MNLLLYMAPIAVVVLVPATLLLEPNVAGDHCGFGTQGCAHAALVVCELHHGLLRQPHKLLGHQAYQCLDLASAGQCEGRHGCGCFHSALSESRLRRWHGGL